MEDRYEQRKDKDKWYHQEILALAIWGFFSYTLIACPETRTREFWIYGFAKPQIEKHARPNSAGEFKRVNLEQGLSLLPKPIRERLITTAK